MKKKLVTVLLAVSILCMLPACGEKKDDSQSVAEGTQDEVSEDSTKSTVSTKDFDSTKYVTVGDYSKLSVPCDSYTYTQEDVDKEIDSEIEYYVKYSDAYDYTVTDKAEVENGDIVNIDYVGKKDDVAFDGGTASGAHLEIGSGSFIDGFESGLIGHKVGESVSLNLTFPETYQNADLAGQAVVFEVKINSIDDRKMPEITDELIKKMDMGVETVADYRKSIEDYMKSTCEDQNKKLKGNAVWEAVYGVCTVSDAPKELVDDVAARIQENAEYYAQYYGITMDEFITDKMQMTKEEYEQQTAESALNTAKEKMAIAELAKQLGITLTDDDVQKAAEEEYASYGYESADALFEDVGKGPYYDYVLSERVKDALCEKVTIIENEPKSIMSLVNGDTSDSTEETMQEDVENVDKEELDAETGAEQPTEEMTEEATEEATEEVTEE